MNAVRCIEILNKACLINDENQTRVAAHANPTDLAHALLSLEEAEILTQENFTVIAVHADLFDLACELHNLQEVGILTQENFTVIAAHANPYVLSSALVSLQKAEILTPENRALVIEHVNSNSLALSLSSLYQAGILTPENRAQVIAHTNPDSLSWSLSRLQRSEMLTPKNFKLVIDHANPDSLASVLSELQQAGMLTQENFTALSAPNHAILVTEESPELIWERIPAHLLTQDNFQKLVTAAEHVNPMEELKYVTNQILGLEVHAGAGQATIFNDTQSTHSASVHQSVSASARKLMKIYGLGLNFEDKILEIKAYVYSLDDSPKHQAAKRCIERITQVDYYFIDTSWVSICELLVLVYTAIHDESKRAGTLIDAMDLLVEGLYEIQRGYNLNVSGQDQGGPDSFICPEGTFNKLIEKLNGIHPDVEVYYITHEGASSKFLSLAKAHATTYLQSLVWPASAGDHRIVADLLKRLKVDASLEPIWDEIKLGVQAELWDEFKTAYNDNQSDARFLALINHGQYLPLPDLTAIESALCSSSEYQVSTLLAQSSWTKLFDDAEVKEAGLSIPTKL